MHRHITYYTFTQLSARVDSTSASHQINFLVVVHGRIYAGFAIGEPTFYEGGGWASGVPQSGLRSVSGFAMRSMSLRDMQISKSEKKILAPPLPNPEDAPVTTINHNFCHF